jgi:hypothetical protein
VLKTDITFERFLNTFVPGAVFVFGLFYFHRPLLLKYFPYVAGYSGQIPADTLGPETRILLFSIAAICVGVMFDQLSDAAIAAVVAVEDDTDRPRRKTRKIVREMNQFFVFRLVPDLRELVLERYLSSPRRGPFTRMMKNWGLGAEAEVESAKPEKAAIVHQHILMHLRTLSEHHHALFREMYSPLSSAAALYCSFIALFGCAILAPFSAMYVAGDLRVHKIGVYVFLIVLAYGGAVLTGYNLKRRIRHFFSQAITMALHAYCINEQARDDAG